MNLFVEQELHGLSHSNPTLLCDFFIQAYLKYSYMPSLVHMWHKQIYTVNLIKQAIMCLFFNTATFPSEEATNSANIFPLPPPINLAIPFAPVWGCDIETFDIVNVLILEGKTS